MHGVYTKFWDFFSHQIRYAKYKYAFMWIIRRIERENLNRYLYDFADVVKMEIIFSLRD